jgi:asparagine synthase (glutamine-hydrolysing)
LPRFFQSTGPIDVKRITGEAETRLAASALSMLLSDRPLGILLSGGVDSSVLVALLPEEIRRETRTFSIGFEDGGYHDEREHARRVARHLGTRHHESVVPLDVRTEWPRVAAMLDEPCADPAAIPAHLVARAASAEVTVLLSGTGGDEVFGGYRRYRLGTLLRRTRWIPRGAARWAAGWLGDRDLHRRSHAAERVVMAQKLLEARSRTTFFESYLSAFEPAPPRRWAEALAIDVDPGRVVGDLWQEMAGEIGHTPRGEEEIAFSSDHLHYLPDDLLLKEDRTTMGASVEGRVPFLDAGLVEFAAGLPLEARFGDGMNKRLLRRIALRHLPEDIALRGKHGFSVPIHDWLRGPLRELAGDLSSGGGSGVFRHDVLRRWLDEHARRRDRSGPLWAALAFELWWREVGSVPADRIESPGLPARVGS